MSALHSKEGGFESIGECGEKAGGRWMERDGSEFVESHVPTPGV